MVLKAKPVPEREWDVESENNLTLDKSHHVPVYEEVKKDEKSTREHRKGRSK